MTMFRFFVICILIVYIQAAPIAEREGDSEEIQRTLDLKQRIHDVLNKLTALRRDGGCPIGFWCGQKRKDEEQKNALEKKSDGGCPPGLLCGQKRKDEERKNALEKKSAGGCPIGFWCGQKRKDEEQKSALERKSDGGCPPGLLCGQKKKDEEQKNALEKNEDQRAFKEMSRKRNLGQRLQKFKGGNDGFVGL